jgi:hypothetical protein
MSYLDVSPMIAALRAGPDQFELADGWLRHTPSRHSFRFGPNDEVEIRAACDCAALAIKPEQKPALVRCFREWELNYWRPLQINREFASHFAVREAARRPMIWLVGRLYEWLLERERSRSARACFPQTS